MYDAWRVMSDQSSSVALGNGDEKNEGASRKPES
jgi:hypothetical protein